MDPVARLLLLIIPLLLAGALAIWAIRRHGPLGGLAAILMASLIGVAMLMLLRGGEARRELRMAEEQREVALQEMARAEAYARTGRVPRAAEPDARSVIRGIDPPGAFGPSRRMLVEPAAPAAPPQADVSITYGDSPEAHFFWKPNGRFEIVGRAQSHRSPHDRPPPDLHGRLHDLAARQAVAQVEEALERLKNSDKPGWRELRQQLQELSGPARQALARQLVMRFAQPAEVEEAQVAPDEIKTDYELQFDFGRADLLSALKELHGQSTSRIEQVKGEGRGVMVSLLTVLAILLGAFVILRATARRVQRSADAPPAPGGV